jgi:hypothetical protein
MLTRRPRAFPAILFLVAAPLLGQWSTVNVEVNSTTSPTRCWENTAQQLTDDVVYLDNPAHIFRHQLFYNPHVEVDDSNNALIMGQGDTFYGYGDSVAMMTLNADGIHWNSNPAPDPGSQSSLVMHFPIPTPGCAPAPFSCDWTWVGGLGGGGTFTKTPIAIQAAAPGNYKYFAAVEVSDYAGTQIGHPYDFDHGDKSNHCDPIAAYCGCAFNSAANPSQAWITWAVSSDGLSWAFVAAGGGTTTTNPLASIKLLALATGTNEYYLLNTPTQCNGMNGAPPGSWGDYFGHSVVMFNPYDNYFYIVLEWMTAGPPGLSTWFRMKFDPYHPYGLGVVQLLTNASGPTPFTDIPCSPAVPGCGIIPAGNAWIMPANYPFSNMSESYDISKLSDSVAAPFVPVFGPANFDSILLTYLSGYNPEPEISVVKGTSRTFPFFPNAAPQLLVHTGLLNGVLNSTCYQPATIKFDQGSFGLFVTSAQQTGADANGAPYLRGFVGGERIDSPHQPSYGGLIPVLLPLTGSATFPVVTGANPSSGPTTGTAISISGVNLAAGSTVTINGVAATGVTLSGGQLHATTQALTAGAIGNVIVTSPNGQTGTLWDGFFADYLDVSASSTPYYSEVVKISRARVSVGCGNANYCAAPPNNSVTRAEMAAFLLKGKYFHVKYDAPEILSGNTGFNDVNVGDLGANFIVELAREGITGGCGGGNYCPTAPVLRSQMAVFIIKAEHGSSYVPPAPTGTVFYDVSKTSFGAAYIEQAYHEGIMLGSYPEGCTSGPGYFCPSTNTYRLPMAHYLVKAFGM